MCLIEEDSQGRHVSRRNVLDYTSMMRERKEGEDVIEVVIAMRLFVPLRSFRPSLRSAIRMAVYICLEQ